jgi:DNA helicase-2/ATP-dependent DNA helicase PcrA
VSSGDGTLPCVDDLLRGLDATQREAVTTRATPLAILAGAGSGKTRVLTRRIAFLAREQVVDARHVLALTFTRKAAGELRTRLGRLGVRDAVTAGTFHAVALAQLRRRAEDDGRTPPALLERKARLLVPLVPARGREAGLLAAEIASEIEWAKARLVPPDGYERAVALAARTPPRPAPEISAIYREYERQKKRRGLVDFDDLIWTGADLLERDAEFSAAQRFRFRHFFVDEFQDASPAQFRLLRAWLGDRHDLCVVGDGDQAIYGFAGADPEYLVRFRAHFPVERYPAVDVVRLGSNYRSTPQIVAVAGAVLDGGRRRASVQAGRPDGPLPEVAVYDTDEAEARGVARAAAATHRTDVRWSRIAVLYRINAQSALFEEAFGRAGIPFRVRGGRRFLDRAEVKVALDELRSSARTAPGRTFAEHLADLAQPDENRPDGGRSEELQEHVDAVVRLGKEYLEADGGPGSVDGFLAFLQTALRADDADPAAGRDDAVELLTFHRAKGLEFDTVFVTGLERGLVPISHAKTSETLAEEQRLLYVALSRAERVLHLSYARERAIGARVSSRTPSQWLSRIERAIDALDGKIPTHAGDASARIADARARVGSGAPAPPGKAPVPVADRPLYEALVEWRRNLARASGTPAYVVFHDATLAAIAAARPRSPRALLTVAGVGPVKVERYGDAVLALVGEHTDGSATGRG